MAPFAVAVASPHNKPGGFRPAGEIQFSKLGFGDTHGYIGLPPLAG